MSRARKKKAPRKTCNATNTARPKTASVTPPSSDSASDGTGSDDRQTDNLDIGRPVELRPEVCDVFEALMYCTYLVIFPIRPSSGAECRVSV